MIGNPCRKKMDTARKAKQTQDKTRQDPTDLSSLSTLGFFLFVSAIVIVLHDYLVIVYDTMTNDEK